MGNYHRGWHIEGTKDDSVLLPSVHIFSQMSLMILNSPSLKVPKLVWRPNFILFVYFENLIMLVSRKEANLVLLYIFSCGWWILSRWFGHLGLYMFHLVFTRAYCNLNQWDKRFITSICSNLAVVWRVSFYASWSLVWLRFWPASPLKLIAWNYIMVSLRFL